METQRRSQRRTKQKAKLDTDFEPTKCQWLHGEPSDFNYCGAPVRKGSSFCPEHHKKSWTSQTIQNRSGEKWKIKRPPYLWW